MKYIKQKNKTDCGIAALAMLCDVTYEEAERSIPWRRQGVLRGTDTKQLREGGAKLGYRVKSTPKSHLLRSQGKGWSTIPPNSLVKIAADGGYWHWVVWSGRKIYDPARGVFLPKRYDTEPISYMQFLEENDDV